MDSRTILALESSPEYALVLEALLGDDGGIRVKSTYSSFLEALGRGEPRLLIVNLADLPSGTNSLSDMRRRHDTPVLALVEDTSDTPSALRSGADYDLVKPFEPDHLTAAVEAVLRRCASGIPSGSGASFALGALTVHPQRRSVERGGREQALSPSEWQLLQFFIAHPGRVLTREQLAAGAWGPSHADRAGQAELYVSRVRRKLEADRRRPRIIETVRGSGYRFVLPADAGDDEEAQAG